MCSFRLPLTIVMVCQRIAASGARSNGLSRVINRSTYLAITSTSRLTGVPTVARPRVVSSRVVGISDTSNQS